jgi:outer membrane protein TolC
VSGPFVVENMARYTSGPPFSQTFELRMTSPAIKPLNERLRPLSCLATHQSFKRLLKFWLWIGITLFAYTAVCQQPAAQQPPDAKPAPSQPAQTPQPGSSPQPTPTTPPITPEPSPSQTSLPIPSQSPPPTASLPQPNSLPKATPSPEPAPFVVPNLPGPSPVPSNAQSPAASPSLQVPTPSGQSAQSLNSLTLDEALRLANAIASSFQQAGLNERIAAEDVKQAQAAFLPRVTTPLSYLYTSPALGLPPATPRTPSYLANNAISEYQAYLNVAGDIDIAGRLRATLAKNRALLAAAHAGTEVARRALSQAVIEAYYGLALATAQLRAAELNLAAAEEFERITSLLFSGGEVASVDLTRAQLQTVARRDELERARANEQVAAGSLRVLVGYDFTTPISTTDLALGAPVDSEFQQFKVDDISHRPEFAQFEAQLRAAREEVRIARADRLPQLSYSLLGGFDTDSLKAPRLKEHTGVSGALSLSIPIFDWGASRSRERQARLRAQVAENERTIALRGFTQQFYAAQTQVISAATRIRLAGAGITQAQNNVNASIARYRAGEAQIIEVTDALTTLAAQRFALYQAIFDYQTALARLRQAAGQ